jgi:hypothetical protein
VCPHRHGVPSRPALAARSAVDVRTETAGEVARAERVPSAGAAAMKATGTWQICKLKNDNKSKNKVLRGEKKKKKVP